MRETWLGECLIVLMLPIRAFWFRSGYHVSPFNMIVSIAHFVQLAQQEGSNGIKSWTQILGQNCVTIALLAERIPRASAERLSSSSEDSACGGL